MSKHRRRLIKLGKLWRDRRKITDFKIVDVETDEHGTVWRTFELIHNKEWDHWNNERRSLLR